MITSKMWNSLLLNAQRSKTKRNISAFKVLAVKSDNGVVSRLEDLLKLDVAPFTDKIIAEYICKCFHALYRIGGTGIDIRSKSRKWCSFASFEKTYRYGIEQEYTLLQTNVKWPLGWPVGGYPGPQVTFLLFTLTSFQVIVLK
ncbi:hypothetical protein BHE74_00031145 [Ensete ventricosum]|nr:hypothetical protein BHE74_00031145 [Ensete ventricosum]